LKPAALALKITVKQGASWAIFSIVFMFMTENLSPANMRDAAAQLRG